MGGILTGRDQQGQSVESQHQATPPPGTPKLAPKSKAPASTQQDPGRRENRHPNDTTEPTAGTTRDESHAFGTWLETIGSTPPDDSITGSQIQFEEPDYPGILECGTDGVCLIMHSSDYDKKTEHRLVQERKNLLQELTQKRDDGPSSGPFRSTAVNSLLDRLHGENKADIIRELHPIICPTAGYFRDISEDQTLWEQYSLLRHECSERWMNYQSPLPGLPVPRPDYYVGFSWTAFSKDQRDKLDAIADDKISFKPTSAMYFPFLTCEALSSYESLSKAENRNCYSMLIAVRSMVEVFRKAKTENAYSGCIMAFSLSHDHAMAYIHAHYPIIDGERTTIYRQNVYKLLLNDMDYPAQLWDFVRNLYEIWAPRLFSRLNEAIDAIEVDIESSGTHDASGNWNDWASSVLEV